MSVWHKHNKDINENVFSVDTENKLSQLKNIMSIRYSHENYTVHKINTVCRFD